VCSLSGDVVSTLSDFSSFCGPLGRVSFVVLRISPSIDSVVVVWNSWGRSLHKSVVSTESSVMSFLEPFLWVVFLVLGISPCVHSVIIRWDIWKLCEVNVLSFLSSNIVSTLSNFSSFSSPLGGVSFVVLRISPGVNSIVVIWDSRSLT